ncbi:thioredoxin domain-containing protein, partial [Corallococcus sp. CA041A]|uniref:DsbA family protein n=1 Tax=Corallococcus sp. CA041A TaxID=2316727 RepID=UPI0011C37D4B
PFCADAFYRLSEFFSTVDVDQIMYVFRNFPLKQIHPHAEDSAEAAEIAADFDKFWDMHSTLFQNQRQLDDEDLLDYAGELDIPPEKFARELYSHSKANFIREQFLSGARSGVNGTPSFFVNEERFPGDVRDLVSTLSDEIGRGH